MTSAFDWSTTAASNTTVAGVSIAEGMNPSGVNNAMRGMAAEVAKLIKDLGGVQKSGGSANAYTLTTNSVHASLAEPRFAIFEANHTNTGAATLALDGLTAKAIVRTDQSALTAGDITSSGMYLVVYEATNDNFQLLNPVKFQTAGDVLDDLNSLGAAAADGEVIVATGAGAFAYESGATLRTSVGVGTGDSPQFTGIELGHATDTTFTRVSAGVAAIEGNNIITADIAASLTVAGVVEIATAAETNTGTDAGRALSPDGLAGSNFGIAYVEIEVFSPTATCTTGDGKKYFHVPAGLTGMNLVEVHAECITAGTTGTMDIQIANATDTTDMLSTKLTIDSAETGSDTAATPAVIDTTKDDIATNDLLRIDVDAVHTTAAKGLIVTLGFQLP